MQRKKNKTNPTNAKNTSWQEEAALLLPRSESTYLCSAILLYIFFITDTSFLFLPPQTLKRVEKKNGE